MRRLLALVVGAALALVSACASIPTSGPVEEVPLSAQPRGIDLAPEPPAEGVTPNRLVEGFLQAMAFLNAGRAFIGAQALGLAEFAVDATVEHVNSRTAFGRPLSKFQAVSFPLAQSKAEIEAMRWLVYHLAWSVDEGNSPMLDASIVKYYATEKAYEVADRALQAFGGMGLLKEGPIERVLMHLRMLRVVEGASGIQQLVITRTMGM